MKPDDHDRLVVLLTALGVVVIILCYLASRVV